MKASLIAAVALYATIFLGSAVEAEPLAGRISNQLILLNEDGSWSYAEDKAGAGVAGFDEAGRGVQLFESVNSETGAVTRSWKQTDAVRGRIDVAISRVVESSANSFGSRVSCIPVYTIWNLGGVRIDRLLLGVDYFENETRIGGFSFMVGPLDDGEKQDRGAPAFHVSDCNGVKGELTVLTCRVSLDENCVAAVNSSEHSKIPLALVTADP